MRQTKEMMLCKLVTLTVMLTYFCVEPILRFEQDCEKNCTKTGNRVICENCIPQTVTVEEVIISKFNESQLIPHIFCNVSWVNVRKLAIQSDRFTSEYYYFTLPDKTFDCLHMINSLQFSISSMNNLSCNAFFGLTNVRILDLTGCNHLTTSHLTVGLSSLNILPQLPIAILTNLGSFYDGIEITQEFIDALSLRNISEIDVSHSTIKLVGADLNWDLLCETVETLDLAYSRIERSPFVLDDYTCSSLRTVNISGLRFPGTPAYVSGDFPIFGLRYTAAVQGMNFFSKSNALVANSLLPNGVRIYVRKSALNLTFENSVTEVHLSGYNIPVLDLELHIYPNYLKYLDISDNKIETLTEACISYLDVEKIDISSNKLENASNTLFHSSHKLIDISLAYNRIKHLPMGIFVTNRNLKKINLAGNQIKEIEFSLEHLVHIEIINLTDNSIELLDEWSRSQIDKLYYNKTHGSILPTHPNQRLAIDLRDNPFSCQCPSKEFIRWFVNSPVFNETMKDYNCLADGCKIPINRKAINVIEDICDKPEREKRKLLMSVFLPTISAVFFVIVFFQIIKVLRRRKIHRRMNEQIELLHEDRHEFRFPVFLSFSSEDTEFVLPYIHQPLQDQLKLITGIDRDLVAIGDRCFRLGRSIFAEMIDLLDECAVVVVVLSKNYCASEYCRLEIEQARLMRKPIVVFMKEFVNENEMNAVVKETFKHFTRATFRVEEDDYRLQQDWPYICQSILHLL